MEISAVFSSALKTFITVCVEKVDCLSYLHVWKQKLVSIVLFG